jgi:hypothetical protein
MKLSSIYLVVPGIFFALQGCSSIVDHTNNLDDPFIVEPTANNSFNGVLAGHSSAQSSDLEIRVRDICSGKGGVEKGPTYKMSAVISGTYYGYQCKGQHQANSRFVPSPQLQQPTVTNAPIMTIEIAKKKCAELGFKQGTEGFGKCVLQLSR